MRRTCIIALMALGLAATAAHAPGYQRIASFRHHFTELKRSESSLTPVERFVFSLFLAKSERS